MAHLRLEGENAKKGAEKQYLYILLRMYGQVTKVDAEHDKLETVK